MVLNFLYGLGVLTVAVLVGFLILFSPFFQEIEEKMGLVNVSVLTTHEGFTCVGEKAKLDFRVDWDYDLADMLDREGFKFILTENGKEIAKGSESDFTFIPNEVGKNHYVLISTHSKTGEVAFKHEFDLEVKKPVVSDLTFSLLKEEVIAESRLELDEIIGYYYNINLGVDNKGDCPQNLDITYSFENVQTGTKSKITNEHPGSRASPQLKHLFVGGGNSKGITLCATQPEGRSFASAQIQHYFLPCVSTPYKKSGDKVKVIATITPYYTKYYYDNDNKGGWGPGYAYERGTVEDKPFEIEQIFTIEK